MSARPWKRILLALALGATLALTWWVSQDAKDSTDSVVGATKNTDPIDRRDQTTAHKATEISGTTIQLERLDRRRMNVGTTDPFKTLSWLVPPPPPPVLTVIEKPRAPALPYQYIGRYQSSDANAKPIFYLTKGEESFAVGIGDKLDERYRIDGITDGQLVIVYLPLAEKQYLPIGYEQ